MKRKSRYLIVLVLVVSLTAFSIITKKSKMTNLKQNGFAVVELFTSQGCSSCPPADKAVAALEQQYPKDVYVLSFHVDYWNYLGWKDVFSKPEYTERQRQYAAQFRLNSIYTPQVVVNGRHEFVGSDQAQLQSAIAGELKTTAAKSMDVRATATDDKMVTVTYNISEAAMEQLHIALIQKQGVTEVKRGENGGRQLHHINIVRDFKTIPAAEVHQGVVHLSIPSDLLKDKCTVMAYLQKNNGGLITAAKQINLQ